MSKMDRDIQGTTMLWFLSNHLPWRLMLLISPDHSQCDVINTFWYLCRLEKGCNDILFIGLPVFNNRSLPVVETARCFSAFCRTSARK